MTMAKANVIFLGRSGHCPALLLWENPPQEEPPLEITRFPQGYSVYSLAVSPDGHRVAVGTKMGLFQVYAVNDCGRNEKRSSLLLDMFHPPAVVGLTFCTDDIIASGGLDGKIRVWSLSSKSQVAEIDAHPGGVLATCRIGSLLLASLGRNRTLHVWDMDTLQSRFTQKDIILPKVQAMTSLDYDPFMCLLVHPSGNGELYVYDIRQEFSLRKLPAHQGDFCAVSCGANRLATAGAVDATLKIWSDRFNQPETQVSTGTGSLAVAWGGNDLLVTVDAAGDAQTWLVESELTPGPRLAKANLRVCQGLPSEMIARSSTDSLRTWRNAKIDEARELFGRDDSDTRVQLQRIVEELRDRGFSPEATLVLADAAKAQGRLLWELDARLAVVRGLGEGPLAVPSMYAIADLLARVCEPKLAIEYFRKVSEYQPDYRDTEQRLSELQDHPLLQLSPETGIRGDLPNPEHVFQDLEKHNILGKSFTWSVVLETKQSIRVGVHIEPEAALRELTTELGKLRTGKPILALRKNWLYQHGDIREIEWVHVCPSCPEPSVAYALELGSVTGGSVVTPYGLFDVSRLKIPPSANIKDHNRIVEDVWKKVIHGADAKLWLTEVNGMVLAAIQHLKGQSTAQVDDVLF